LFKIVFGIGQISTCILSAAVNGSELIIGHDSWRIMSPGTWVRGELGGTSVSPFSFSLK